MRTVARNIVRFSRDRKARLYCAACVCLLMVAVGLRFHALPEHYLWPDEAAVANSSRGTFSETISNTRRYNSAPILYPLALWVVQKVESTPFSLRVVPATASVLTVAVILLVLPRLGVTRGTALLAAIFATLSVEAIQHAQDAREYSIDALLAVLMTAGLLWHLRDGRKALLCTSLFLAPLLQYGLVLFGAAVLGTALVFPPHATLAAPEGHSGPGRIRHWLQQRIALLWPAACFLAGCALSYPVTVHHQRELEHLSTSGYLAPHFYQGPFDAPSLFGFAIDGLWNLLTYHLPEVVAIAALPAFVILLVVAFRSKCQGSALAVLFFFCMAVSVGAAVLGLYPFGGIRQAIYLGPIVFLAVGLAFYWTAGGLAALTRRTWLAPAMVVTAGGAIALAGVGDIWRELELGQLYLPHDKGEEIVAVLEERAQEEDVVYVFRFMANILQFHQAQNPIVETKASCSSEPETCFQEMIAAISPQAGRSRLWVVAEQPWHTTEPELKVLQALAAHVSVEHVVAGGMPNLYLIEDTEALLTIAAATDMLQNIEPILPRQPTVRATFDLYLREDMMIYFKKPCGAEDMQAPFFLHVDPADASDLPVYHRQHGFGNIDFRFHDYSLPLAEGCVAVRALPDYPIIRLRTGQYTDAGPVWAESLLHREHLERILEQAGEPVIHSIFDVHRYENQLLYVKEPCGAEDVQAPFFLHVDPADASDLPIYRKWYGFDNLDFDWSGERRDGQCRAIVKLPEYAIAGIRTGQYVGEDQIWKGEFLFVK